MKELSNDIPDPDAVLAIEPEELAGILLRLLRERCAREDNHGQLHPTNIIDEIGYSRTSGYPPERAAELKQVAGEAFAWLKAQGFLVPATSGNNANSGWMILSRPDLCSISTKHWTCGYVRIPMRSDMCYVIA